MQSCRLQAGPGKPELQRCSSAIHTPQPGLPSSSPSFASPSLKCILLFQHKHCKSLQLCYEKRLLKHAGNIGKSSLGHPSLHAVRPWAILTEELQDTEEEGQAAPHVAAALICTAPAWPDLGPSRTRDGLSTVQVVRERGVGSSPPQHPPQPWSVPAATVLSAPLPGSLCPWHPVGAWKSHWGVRCGGESSSGGC